MNDENCIYNPHYNPDKLGLVLYSIDEPNMHYEYNTLDFWATSDGRIYSTSDSGCSCPIPFEQYSGRTQDEVVQQLERVENVDHALRLFDSWNQGYIPGVPLVNERERKELQEWIEAHITNLQS